MCQIRCYGSVPRRLLLSSLLDGTWTCRVWSNADHYAQHHFASMGWRDSETHSQYKHQVQLLSLEILNRHELTFNPIQRFNVMYTIFYITECCSTKAPRRVVTCSLVPLPATIWSSRRTLSYSRRPTTWTCRTPTAAKEESSEIPSVSWQCQLLFPV